MKLSSITLIAAGITIVCSAIAAPVREHRPAGWKPPPPPPPPPLPRIKRQAWQQLKREAKEQKLQLDEEQRHQPEHQHQPLNLEQDHDRPGSSTSHSLAHLEHSKQQSASTSSLLSHPPTVLEQPKPQEHSEKQPWTVQPQAPQPNQASLSGILKPTNTFKSHGK